MNYWNVIGCGLGLFLAGLPFTPLWMNIIMVLVAVLHAIALLSVKWGYNATLINALLSVVVCAFSYPFVSVVTKAFQQQNLILESMFVLYYCLSIVGIMAGEKYLRLYAKVEQ